MASKHSLEGQAEFEKSTDFPILLNLSDATDSITCRISGNSSTTSLKSSACKINMSHIVFATIVAVRLACVRRQISEKKIIGKNDIKMERIRQSFDLGYSI